VKLCRLQYQCLSDGLFVSIKYVSETVQAASHIADAYAEPHPLWEYPARPLCMTFDLLHVNLAKPLHGISSLARSGSVELTRSAHAVVQLKSYLYRQ